MSEPWVECWYRPEPGVIRFRANLINGKPVDQYGKPSPTLEAWLARLGYEGVQQWCAEHPELERSAQSIHLAELVEKGEVR